MRRQTVEDLTEKEVFVCEQRKFALKGLLGIILLACSLLGSTMAVAPHPMTWCANDKPNQDRNVVCSGRLVHRLLFSIRQTLTFFLWLGCGCLWILQR